MKKILTLIMALAMSMTMFGCSKAEPEATEAPEAVATEEAAPAVEDVYARTIGFTIEMADGGIMSGVLYPDLAPITVENFVKLAGEGFYDGLVFHRVIEDFMIQGGGYDDIYNPKDTDTIKGEFAANGVENNLKHERGVLSMARTLVPDSASSQFFIMHKASPHLDGQYAAFGIVTEGLDVLDKIATSETTTLADKGMEDVPVNPVVIKSIIINE